LIRPDLAGARLVLTTRRGRVEWQLIPQLAMEEGLVDIRSVHLGPFTDVLRIFLGMMREWLSTAGLDITRIALGVTLRLPTESKEAAYSLVSKYVPCPLPTDSSDFLYRLNRPRPSTSLPDHTLINRLAAWSVIHLMAVRIAVSGGGAEAQTVSREGEAFFACRVELDINTAVDRPGNLPPAGLDALLAEFGDLAVEIATEGDKP